MAGSAWLEFRAYQECGALPGESRGGISSTSRMGVPPHSYLYVVLQRRHCTTDLSLQWRMKGISIGLG
ncbi:hypothetical protein Syun_028052 [Stephania yunnanensis]|uniref:Uncharacterized protein n=1 Tax=Stephania yunnanensis TaxID=152371 RepID=A0AAP0EGN0_9MAGN